MHEEQQIYDSPTQPSQQVPQVLAPQNRSKIKQTLIQAFAILCQPSPTQQALNQCHKTIGQYQKRQQILSILFQLVLQFSPHNETLTKLVITQIFTYMKKQSSFGYEERHEKTKIARMFLDFFVQTQVEFKFKKMLQKSFMQFIFASQNVKLRQLVAKYVEDKLTKILASTEKSLTDLQSYNKLSSPVTILIPATDIASEENIRMSFSLMHVIKCLLMGGNLEIELMKTFLSSAFSIYYRMTLEIAKIILVAITSKQEAVFVRRVDECASFTEILLLMFAKTDSGKFPTLRQRILHTKQVYQLVLVLMNLSTNFQSFEAVQNLFQQHSLSSGQQLSKQAISFQVGTLVNQLGFEQNFLNIPFNDVQSIDVGSKKTVLRLISIKKHSIQILIKCIKTLQRKKSQILTEYPYLTAIIINVWLKVKDCLIGQTEKYLKRVQSSSLTDPQAQQMKNQQKQLFGVSLKFLSQVVNLPCFYNMVSTYQSEVIFNLCFPWLISRKQHDKFQAEDYLFFREDIVNKQNMSYIENNIAALLESYLDNIDGAISTIMVNCPSLMSYQLTKDQLYLEGLSMEIKNSWFIHFYATERLVESALTLVAVESYLSLRRNDIVLLLEKWLYSHKGFFLQVNNDYRITVQFLMMYSYYADNFYSNLIQGISSQDFYYRGLHQEVLKFCCYLMKENYDYEKNSYKGRVGQILYFSALDCLNNSLNHTELIPTLYYNFPPKQQVPIPHYMLPYENYPFYPIKQLKEIPKKQLREEQISQGFLNPHQRAQRQQQQKQNNTKKLLVHYRKMGLNRDEYIDKDPIVEMMQFLGENLSTRANIKIVDILVEFLIGYIKQEMKHQGAMVNIPVVFREDVATLLAAKVYSLFHEKTMKLPNRGLFEAKATQLIYVLHCISVDPYYIYSLGWEVVWANPEFWNFDPSEDDNNVDKLLKCTDLVVRLALKHYSSQKGVNIKELIEKISHVFIQHSFQYVSKIHKFNILFGILLNLVLLKVNPQQMFQFLFFIITEKLMKAELKQTSFDEQQQVFNEVPASSASDLLGQAFYLFLVNMYINPTSLNTQKNFKLLTVFTEYLTHYVNAHQIVTQLGDLFGKIFACCLCILEKEYMNNTLGSFDKNTLQFLWRNILYSGKIYKSELETRIVSIKLLSLVREIIKRNDPDFSLERLEQMYQVSCSCVFYSKNKDFLINNDEDGLDEDFDHAGEEQEWENSPITMSRNDTEIYIEDEVFFLKKTSRELLQSPNIQIKQWLTRLIESLPVAVKNFVKNKVINYDQQSKEIGLRKIIKVKRPQQDNLSGVTKKQIVRQNIQMRKETRNDESDESDE